MHRDGLVDTYIHSAEDCAAAVKDDADTAEDASFWQSVEDRLSTLRGEVLAKMAEQAVAG